MPHAFDYDTRRLWQANVFLLNYGLTYLARVGKRTYTVYRYMAAISPLRGYVFALAANVSVRCVSYTLTTLVPMVSNTFCVSYVTVYVTCQASLVALYRWKTH